MTNDSTSASSAFPTVGRATGRPAGSRGCPPAGPAAGRGVDLLHEFVSSHPGGSSKPLAQQIREAAAKGDALAQRIMRDGVLGGLEEWMERRR